MSSSAIVDMEAVGSEGSDYEVDFAADTNSKQTPEYTSGRG